MLKRKASIYVYITSFVSAAALIFGLFAVIALPFALYFAYCIVRYRRPADPEARAAVRNGDGVIVEEAWWGFAFLPCPIEAAARAAIRRGRGDAAAFDVTGWGSDGGSRRRRGAATWPGGD